MQSHFIKVNNIEIHYLHLVNENKPKLIMLHGLTANAHAFDGLIFHGLKEHFELIIPDLRGRGLSTIPAFEYSMEEHALDIIDLMEALGLKSALFCGHSFGGYLSIFIASHYVERVEKIILLDAAMEMNENAAEMLMPTLARLDETFPSITDFLEKMKAAPQNTFWEKYMEDYYRADVYTKEDGSVNPHSNLTNIIDVSMGMAAQPWQKFYKMIEQPVLLINASENYGIDEPLLPDFKAKQTVDLLKNGKYVAVGGNHFTMNYGSNAQEVNKAIVEFLT